MPNYKLCGRNGFFPHCRSRRKDRSVPESPADEAQQVSTETTEWTLSQETNNVTTLTSPESRSVIYL